MSDNKYKMFRNYMANELGITKEEIKEWTMEAVKETAEKALRGYSLEKIASDFAKVKVADSWASQLALEKAFERVLQEKLEFSVKVKEDSVLPDIKT